MSINRQSKEYREWRKNVLSRDLYKCTKCGSIDHLEAHHILPVASFPEEALNINNGITLCKKCHYKMHNKSCSNLKVTMPNLHPIFSKLRDLNFYLAYRRDIVRSLWRNIPLPKKFKKWIESLIVSIMLLALLVGASLIRSIFNVY